MIEGSSINLSLTLFLLAFVVYLPKIVSLFNRDKQIKGGYPRQSFSSHTLSLYLSFLRFGFFHSLLSLFVLNIFIFQSLSSYFFPITSSKAMSGTATNYTFMYCNIKIQCAWFGWCVGFKCCFFFVSSLPFVCCKNTIGAENFSNR